MTGDIYMLLIISIVGVALIIIGFIAVQVRNQKKLLQKQQQLAAAESRHQKNLLEAVIMSQEAERQRIGSDLHDEVGTLLSSLRIIIDNRAGKSLHDSNTDPDTRAKELIDRVVNNVRRVAHNLSPHIKGEFGCYDALMELCGTVDQACAVRVNALFDEQDIPVQISEGTALSVYRIIAELINNTLKHGNATEIILKMQAIPGKWIIQYSDNGVGFSMTDMGVARGMGWKNIESRLSVADGTHSMTSAPGKGLNVVLTIPAN
jgi:signal transduction histidine kinase